MKHKMTPEQIDNSMKLADLLINHPKDVPFDLDSMGACAMKHYARFFRLHNDSEMGGAIEETFGLSARLFYYMTPRGDRFYYMTPRDDRFGPIPAVEYPGDNDSYTSGGGSDIDPVAFGKYIKTLVAENAIMVPE